MISYVSVSVTVPMDQSNVTPQLLLMSTTLAVERTEDVDVMPAGKNGFLQRLLTLGLVSERNPDSPRVTDTMHIELAESFSWHSVEETPAHTVLNGDYYEASIQRTSNDTWHLRCFRNSFVNQIIAASNSASAEARLRALFDVGWFREPRQKPTALVSSIKTAIVSKPKATRRPQVEIEAEWHARVGREQIAGRVVLISAGPEHDPVRYVESSIQDVYCVPCQHIGVCAPYLAFYQPLHM